jgi:hypothetical protein
MKLNDLVFEFNKLVVHPAFEETIREVSELAASLPDFTPNVRYLPGEMLFSTGELVTPVGSIQKTLLSAQRGTEQVQIGRPIAAYDESIGKYASLEGTAYLTSHSLVLVSPNSYVPVNYLTFYFYTRSKELANRSKHMKHSEDPEMDSKKDYILDRIRFLEETAPENSILLIDGPLIGGDVYTIMMGSIQAFHEKNIIPVFFVKNSSSNLVTDNITELREKYNSDLHWSYKYLRPGERTNFFIYRDKVNPRNAKAFCYLKAFEFSPQRVEFHLNTYSRYESLVDNLMDLVYYLLIVQGNAYNPQVRPIAVAEMYARETLGLVDIFSLMKEAGITPTMNQVRFGG